MHCYVTGYINRDSGYIKIFYEQYHVIMAETVKQKFL